MITCLVKPMLAKDLKELLKFVPDDVMIYTTSDSGYERPTEGVQFTMWRDQGNSYSWYQEPNTMIKGKVVFK